MSVFEVFVQQETIEKSDWDRLLAKIISYSNNSSVEIVFDNNIVEFFVHSDKDLSMLSAKLDGFVLKPVNKSHFGIEGKKVKFNLSSKLNILELREKEEIKKQRILTNVLIDIKRVLGIKLYSITILLNGTSGNKYYSRYASLINPFLYFEFDFKNSSKIKKKSTPPSLKFDEALNLFKSQSQDSILEVFGFPYFSHPTFLPMKAFDFDKHGLIVGQTGVGKSKFIELFIKTIEKIHKEKGDKYSVVVIDPHANLYSNFTNLESNKIDFDFVKNACELFPTFSEPKIATELTILLFKTLLKDQFNAKMERVLKYALFTLFLNHAMTLTNTKKFLTEIEFRKQTLLNLHQEFGYLNQFFDTEYVELQTRFYEIAIMPILVLIDELQFVPAFSKNPSDSLEYSLSKNFLTSFSLNRIYLGDKATRLIAGLIIQQLFLLAQCQVRFIAER